MNEQSTQSLPTTGRNWAELEWVATHRCPKCGGKLGLVEQRIADGKRAWAVCKNWDGCCYETEL
jgi:hypothetical protein